MLCCLKEKKMSSAPPTASSTDLIAEFCKTTHADEAVARDYLEKTSFNLIVCFHIFYLVVVFCDLV